MSGGPLNTIGRKAEYAGRAYPCSRVTNRPGTSRANAGIFVAGEQPTGGIAKVDKAFASIPNFRPTLSESVGWNKISIAIDTTSNQFAIAASQSQPRVSTTPA